MKGFYKVTEKIKESLKAHPMVNTVSYGNIHDIDLDKTSIYPISHILVRSFNEDVATTTFDFSIICMDIVTESKENTIDSFAGNNNEHDVMNTQAAVIQRLMHDLRGGDLQREGFEMESSSPSEGFTDRFNDRVAGWSKSFSVRVLNNFNHD